MDLRVLADAMALADAREPFALATVIWRRGPSSGQVGAKALIRPDGSVQGWLGGACAQPTVIREARDAMADGQPRLLFLGPSDDAHAQAAGVVTVPMACESEGAMEVYIEPFLPRPHLVVVGRSPAVTTLTTLAVALDWHVHVIDDGGDPRAHPHPELVHARLDLSDLAIGPSTAIVVATQGHYDDLALEAALATSAGYVGLIASAKRAASTVALLRGRGVDDEQLCRVVAPAGLDLGPVENAEIGVAVLADLVARRAAGQLAPVAPAVVRTVVDPVCHMAVDVASSRYHVRHEGLDVWFCAAGCKAAFEADPAAYAGAGG